MNKCFNIRAQQRFTRIALALISTLSITPFRAQTVFEEVSDQAGIDIVMNSINLFGSGSAWFDYNNDGNMDLYVTGGNTQADILYEGDGQGNFTDVTMAAGLGFTSEMTTYGVTTGDIDNDGDRDIFLCTTFGTNSALFLNNGDGTFTDISASAGFNDTDRAKHGATFGDVNLDGYLDIYVTSWIETFRSIKNAANETIGYAHDCFPDLLYINDGDNTFTESASAYGIDNIGCGLVPAFSDFDNDHDMDAIIVNDFGPWVEPNALYRNEYPQVFFTDVSGSSNMDQGTYGMGVAIGDYDHDMDLDYYFTSIDSNRFMQNQGNGVFIDLARQLGVEDDTLEGSEDVKTSWGAAFLDIDNDRYDDLFVADGKVGVFLANANDDPNKLYLNDGNGGFSDISAQAGIDSPWSCRGLCYADYDKDGDLDVFIHTSRRDTTREAHSLLYENKLPLTSSQNWLRLELEGIKSNRDGFGAHLEIYVDGDSWLKEIDGGSSYRSQHETAAHIGLGSAETVDSIIITWPGGQVQKLYDLSANQSIEVLEDTMPPVGIRPLKIKEQLALNVWPNPSMGDVSVRLVSSRRSEATLRLIDLSGSVVLQKGIHVNKGPNLYNISTSALASGVYFLELKTNKSHLNERLIINN